MDNLTRRAKFQAIENAEKAGLVADSMEVRLALIARVKAGEITMEECQTELKRIKRNAKSNGQQTRTQVFRGA